MGGIAGDRLSRSYTPNRRQQSRPQRRRPDMAWKTPKFDETPVGMEINMYACAKK